MKKLLVLLLALVLVAGLCACGAKSASIAGHYTLHQVTEGGEVFYVEQDPSNPCVELKADGTAQVVDLEGRAREAVFQDGQTWFVDNPSAKMPYTIKGNTLTINDGRSEMVFKKN